MSARSSTHETETKSRQIFESAVTDYGDMLFRNLTERDYGIDGVVELFSNGEPTGRFAHIQLKSTCKEIEKLKTDDAVSCPGISKSNLGYCRQNNIPVMLVYVSTKTKKFYYIDLQSIYQGKIEEIADKKKGTVRIPFENNSDDLSRFVNIINSYYETNGFSIVSNRKDIYCDQESDGELITTYEFHLRERPADGEHKEIGNNDEVIAVGCWIDGKLQNGTEYNYLVKVIKGGLIFKPECPDDPYDASKDFEYEKLEQYGWYVRDVFLVARNYIVEDGMDNYFVADFDVTEDTEQLKNIRTLREFLFEKEPEWLSELEEEIKGIRK